MPGVVVRPVFKGVGCSQHALPNVVFDVRTPIDDTGDRFE
jgi:hypothetical protein